MSATLRDSKTSWIDKYRPADLDHMVMNSKAKRFFKSIIDSDRVPNLILHGNYGVGKTTIARLIGSAAMKDTGSSWNYLPQTVRCSDAKVADLINTAIDRMQSPNIWSEIREVWVLDEVDKLSLEYQARFLGVLEDNTYKNAFILTANDISKVHRGLQDRCTPLCFDFDEADKTEFIASITKLGERILGAEGIEFTSDNLDKFVESRWSQPRSFVMDLETFSVSGELLIF